MRGPDRILPHSPDLEATVLRAMLQDDGVAATVAATLAPDDFFNDKHRWIFTAAVRCVRCVNRGIACDVHTVGEELNRQGKLLDVSSEYLARLVDAPPLPGWAHHARLLQEKAHRRRLILAGERIAAQGYADQEPLDEYRAHAEALLFQATQAGPEDDLLTPQRLVATLDKCDPPFTLTTGFKIWDEPTPLLEEGCMTVLAGRPGIGKTALACHILARHALADHPVPCLFFSCEQTGRQIANRSLAIHAGRTLYEQKTDPNPWDVEKLGKSALYVRTAGAPSLATVLAKTRADRAMYGIRLAVLDHIGKVSGGRKETRTLEVGDVVRGLKATAKDLRVPVLALCQLNRAVEGRNVKRPQLSDLRESGEIEQEADSVMFLWTPEDALTKAQIEIRMTLAKSRDGTIGEARMVFDRPRLRFNSESTEDMGRR